MALSGLEALAQVHEQQVAEQVKVIPIPGNPVARLRIRALDHTEIGRFAARVDQAKGREARANAELKAAAGSISAATDALLLPDDTELDLNHPELLRALKLDPEAQPPVLEVLRALCGGKDGLVLKLSNAVAEHSGYSNEAMDEEFAGE